VEYKGPSFPLLLWGEIDLGAARYPLVLGLSSTGVPGLWVDQNGDGVIETGELALGAQGSGFYVWQASLTARPAGGKPYSYVVTILWIQGKGFVYLIGGSPRAGELSLGGKQYAIALVDGDINGVYGSQGDFYAVDTDGDGTLYGGLDGHEHFAIDEPFTIGQETFKLAHVAPDGSGLTLERTSYVPPKTPLIPGYPAPDFSFSTFRGGKELALSDLRGKVVLLDFWATWCEPCMVELPNVKRVYQTYHDKGFEIVGISLDTNEVALREVLEKEHIPWPQYFDGLGWDNKIARSYRVFSIPTSFVLDHEGVIRYRDVRGEELEKAVAKLISELPEETPPPEGGPSGVAPSGQTPSQVSLPPQITVPPETPPAAEPILKLSVPERVGILPGGNAELAVVVENSSQYEAENITLEAVNLPQGVRAGRVELEKLPAFGSRQVVLKLEAGDDVSRGDHQIGVKLSYHYCIGDSCFAMGDSSQLTLAVGEPPSHAKAPWQPWWLLLLLAAGLAAAWFIFGKGASALFFLIALLAGASLLVGVRLGQAHQAQLIGAVICTSCVGLEEEAHGQPHPSQSTLAELSRVSRPVHLVVFHAPWCRSCPFAIAMAKRFSEANANIEVELVDAEVDFERAQRAGVYQSGRLVVPAILNADTGEVIFGTTDLERRLLALVEGGKR
jgi:thiol-disulfide isomerase/thioredoxin